MRLTKGTALALPAGGGQGRVLGPVGVDFYGDDGAAAQGHPGQVPEAAAGRARIPLHRRGRRSPSTTDRPASLLPSLFALLLALLW